MFRVWLLAANMSLLLGNLTFAQARFPSSGSIFPTPGDLNRHHMNPLGKPCLTLKGDVKAKSTGAASVFASPGRRSEPLELSAPTIYEHIVKANNSCGQNIKVKVCYYKTDDCIMMNVPPWGRQDGVLGIFPGQNGFRYDAREQF